MGLQKLTRARKSRLVKRRCCCKKSCCWRCSHLNYIRFYGHRKSQNISTSTRFSKRSYDHFDLNILWPKIKKFFKIFLPLGLGVFLVWYSLADIDTNEFIGYFKNANYSWIFLGLFCGLLSHLSRAYRWKFMLEPLGYTPKFANSTMAVLVAYLVNYTIPRAGEASRAAVMTNYEGIPFEKGFGTIVAERIADLIMMLCIIIITLFVQFDFIYELLVDLNWI